MEEYGHRFLFSIRFQSQVGKYSNDLRLIWQHKKRNNFQKKGIRSLETLDHQHFHTEPIIHQHS
jgi:hypothetical protein